MYNYGFKQNESEYDQDMLIDAANTEIKALECITNNYALNSILKKNIEKIRKHIINSTNANTYQLLWKKSYDESAVSYLNIDSILEDQRVRQKVYQYKNQLCDILLAEGHKVDYNHHNSNTTVVAHNTSALEKANRIKELINDLKSASSDGIFKMQYEKGRSDLEQAIVKAYREHMGFVDRTELLNVLENAAQGRDKRKVVNIGTAILFSTLNEQDPYKKKVNELFQTANFYSPNDLKKQWNKVFMDTSMHAIIESNDSAVKFTNLYFNVTKRKKDSHYRLVSHKTPVKVLKTRPIDVAHASLLDLAYLS